MEHSNEELINILKKVEVGKIDEFIKLRTEILSNQNQTQRIVGANYTAGRMILGGYNSSENKFFKEDSVIGIAAGMGDVVNCTTGDLTEAYKLLIDKVRLTENIDFETLMQLVYETVYQYFGDTSRHEERMEYFPDEDFIENNLEEHGKIASLAGRNSAMCVERAVLSHNLMKLVGIDSTYKSSGILNDKKQEIHSYNLVKHEGKAYIFDSTIPRGMENGEITPLITEIPEEVYEKISNSSSSVGHAVQVEYFSPISGRDRNITYDAGHSISRNSGLDR